jgi:hypothetical protein
MADMPAIRRVVRQDADLTVSNTAVPPSTEAPDGAKHALISVVANPVRMSIDGGDAAATDGLSLAVGVHDFFMNPNADFETILKDLSFIREGASDGTVSIIFFD